MSGSGFVPLPGREQSLSDAESAARARACFERLRARRSVRMFSERPIAPGVLEDCLRTAGTAPSGANLQPWRFVVVRSADTKRRVREAAEAEEREFYGHRAPPEWRLALERLGTDENKPFLETAPALVAIFGERWGTQEDGLRRKHYYVDESVGIATGLLIAALHESGLATLTHTPSPMRFLNEILERPDNERPFLLLVVGYPASDAVVPDIQRKPLDEIATFLD